MVGGYIMGTREYAIHCLTECAKFGITYNKIILAVNLPPVPAPRMTAADKWKKRPCVLRYFQFKTALRQAAKQQGIMNLPCVLNVVFVMPLPKKISKAEVLKRKYQYHQQTPDRDNLLKSVQDAFLGDDSHCADGRSTKIWGDYPMIILYE